MKRLLLATTVAAVIGAPIAASAQEIIYDRNGGRHYDYNNNGIYDEYDRSTDYDDDGIPNRLDRHPRRYDNAPFRGYSSTAPGYNNRYYRSEDRYGRYWQRGDYLPQSVLRDNRLYEWRRFDLTPPADQNNAWFLVGDQYVMANIYNGLVAMTVPRRD
jgi:Ni/Co efflux regulator RcnB